MLFANALSWVVADSPTPGLVVLVQFVCYGVAFVSLGLWEYKFSQRPRGGTVWTKNAVLAIAVLVAITVLTVGRLRTMGRLEAVLLLAGGLGSAAYYFWVRRSPRPDN